MARARNIKPGFFTNDVLAELPALTRLFFIGLWTIADREGRLEDRPKKIRAEVLPYDDCNADDLLDALAARGFIRRYEAAGGRFIQIANFAKHQNPHVKEAASTIPPPDEPAPAAAPAPGQPVSPAGAAPDEHGASTGNSGTSHADSGFRIPDSGFPPPDSGSRNPDPPTPSSPAPRARAPRPRGGQGADDGETELQAACKATWAAYAHAYELRHGAKPLRDATVNAQIKRFVQRVGFEESPGVAAFFVEHNDRFYVLKKHPPDLLLRDAAKLRTEWVTGRQVTATQAQQVDRTQANLNAFAGLLAEAREQDRASAQGKEA